MTGQLPAVLRQMITSKHRTQELRKSVLLSQTKRPRFVPLIPFCGLEGIPAAEPPVDNSGLRRSQPVPSD